LFCALPLRHASSLVCLSILRSMAPSCGEAFDREGSGSDCPLSQFFDFDELEVLEQVQEAAVCTLHMPSLVDDVSDATEDAMSLATQTTDAETSAIDVEQVDDEWSTYSELGLVLLRQRSRLSLDAVFESSPSESTADASHLDGLKFNAPPANQWLRQFRDPVEDKVADRLAHGLASRGLRPWHAPRADTAEEVQKLRDMASAVEEQRKELASEQARLGGEKEDILRREAEVRRREIALAEELEQQRLRDDARRNYPPPCWLERIEGTINIGVVGHSGVGKSLLINKLRGLKPGSEGWAPVGINETTFQVAMYAFPNERRARLWDFPGAGTEAFPLETYIAKMGLRYFDRVVIVTAGRFTQTEVQLREELDEHRVPYCMVRTKVDLDIYNNRQDNNRTEKQSLNEIRHDLMHNRNVRNPYLVSLRNTNVYDFPKLLTDIFPVLEAKDLEEESWALPVQYSFSVSGLQGRWSDHLGTVFLVQGLDVHITNFVGGSATSRFVEDDAGRVWYRSTWFTEEAGVKKAHRDGVIVWRPDALKGAAQPLVRWKRSS